MVEEEEKTITKEQPAEPCKVCLKNPSKYKCPKCSLKTCSLNCVKLHKERYKCTGVPDKAAFVGLKSFTMDQIQKDVGYLTDVIDTTNRNSKKFAYDYGDTKVEGRFKQLRYICRAKRNCTLKIGPTVFETYKKNKSYYKRQEDTIFWTIGCTLIRENDALVYFFEEPISEKTKISEITQKFIIRTQYFSTDINEFLSKYEAKDFDELRVFIKTIQKKENEGEKDKLVYKELKKENQLTEELKGGIITDSPMLYLVFPDINVKQNKAYANLAAKMTLKKIIS